MRRWLRYRRALRFRRRRLRAADSFSKWLAAKKAKARIWEMYINAEDAKEARRLLTSIIVHHDAPGPCPRPRWRAA